MESVPIVAGEMKCWSRIERRLWQALPSVEKTNACCVNVALRVKD
jgi:hypothetical protein